jgi:hypothetical protein
MATRARLGLELKNGSILSVYHHWDGYPEWLGRILNTHYNTRAKVAELIDGGDMSSAWTNCGWQNETRSETGPMYYSERGEECPPRLDADLCEYLNKNNSGEEYAYVFRSGNWVCYNLHEFDEQLPEVVEIPSGELAV